MPRQLINGPGPTPIAIAFPRSIEGVYAVGGMDPRPRERNGDGAGYSKRACQRTLTRRSELPGEGNLERSSEIEGAPPKRGPFSDHL